MAPTEIAVVAYAAAGRYLHWGVIQISVTNLVVIAVMVILFVLALVVPFPGGHDDGNEK